MAKQAAYYLCKRYNGLHVVGTYSPPMGFEKDEKEIEKAIKIVNESKPDILLVALGAPKQEKFMYKYGKFLNAHVEIGLGASLDFAAGRVKRAPNWMSRHGMVLPISARAKEIV